MEDRWFRFVRQNINGGPGMHCHIIGRRYDMCYCYPEDATASVWVSVDLFTNPNLWDEDEHYYLPIEEDE